MFSLAKLARITAEGVTFQSHIDGSRHLLTPEKAIEIQGWLDSDIMMCLDQCTAYPATREEAVRAAAITLDWARRCRDAWVGPATAIRPCSASCRAGCTPTCGGSRPNAWALGFSGYALGGLSVGEPLDLMLETADFACRCCPRRRPSTSWASAGPRT